MVRFSCSSRLTSGYAGRWSASSKPHSKRVLLICCQVLVVLDEAYIEFSEEQSRLGWPARYENLVVLRTFSKSAGLAGEHLPIHRKKKHGT